MKRRVNKYIEARRARQMQPNGIRKCQTRFSEANPDFKRIYKRKIEGLNLNEPTLSDLYASGETYYTDTPLGDEEHPIMLEGYRSPGYSGKELYDAIQSGKIKTKYLDRSGKQKVKDYAAELAADELADRVSQFQTNMRSGEFNDMVGKFALAAPVAAGALAAPTLPAILDTGGTALGFLGSPLSTTVQSATNLVPSLAQYSWLQPSLFAGGIGTALTSCSPPEVRKKEEERKKR